MSKPGRVLESLVGRVFGRLKVTGLAPDRRVSYRAEWLCTCECGKTCRGTGQELRAGRKRSCGCLRRENFIAVLQMARARRKGGMRAATRKELGVDGHKAERAVSRKADEPAKTWIGADDAGRMLQALLG